tara:strand:+ start:903 stop:1418 length:516 start_codon:yes stop_codon:yes gene_type:complete
MDTIKTFLTHPFFWGFVLGFFLCILSLVAHWRTRADLKRLKGHLSDKLEIEAENMAELKKKIDGLREENENLRLKINSGRSQDNFQMLDRELEIFVRAEKAMVVNAPGFAQAWEKAKEAALTEVEAEESGKSFPRRVFKKFFSKGGTTQDAEMIEALPEESTTKSASSIDS